MTQTKRMTAIASAFTLALLTGSAAVYANSKERIGIDNVDKCETTLRDPECTNDTAMGEAVVTENNYGDSDDIGAGDPFENSDVEAFDGRDDDTVGVYVDN